jgi:hypothetical protein
MMMVKSANANADVGRSLVSVNVEGTRNRNARREKRKDAIGRRKRGAAS